MESPQQQDPRVGIVLNGRYRITELLGEGGMGLVYRGERLQLGRPVAIKFLHLNYAKSPKFVARFDREARAMSKLSHPYCVSVIDFGVHDEPYIVMDFVVGQTLRELMDSERLVPQRAVQIARQLLAGLAHAHGQGVIHRDIKPGNIMVGEATGMGDHVRIFDFGLAKLHDTTVEGDHSVATVIGTPAYMSPEQTRAEPIDARADLYATGVLLFEMLTGEKPFTGDDAYEVIRKQRDEPPPLVTSLAPGVSVELAQVVATALEKERERRYQSATDFVAALDAVPEAYARSSSLLGEPTPPLGADLRRPESTPTGQLAGDRGARARRLALGGLLGVAAVGTFVYVGARSPASETTQVATRAPAPREEAPAVAAPALDAGLVQEEAAAPDVPVAPPAPELSEEALAEADRALSLAAEQATIPDAGGAVPAQSISEVHTLMRAGRLAEAILGLRALREKSPYNPYYPFLLGDLYFETGAWGDGLAKYREAMRLNERYRARESIHTNAIRALGHDETYLRGLVLLERDVGEAARQALEKASTDEGEPLIAGRARLILERIARDGLSTPGHERRTEE